ncbi:hypothetical protein [Micromonospora arborensis]|uniref:hypothetical protein n=1 Tax=Micromonospora arborensis TaxID=2116518 RepID=UPI0011B7782A|nr:hypothetical protein [Micromonospora arborensis]
MQSMNSGNHWLYSWIDEFEANTPEAARRALSSSSAINRLEDLARLGAQMTFEDVPYTGTVVAGPGLEITSPATCSAFECRRLGLDNELGSVLHYFDQVVMQGPQASAYLMLVEQLRSSSHSHLLTSDVVQDVASLNYIRDSGMGNHIIFTDKPCYCENHLWELAQNIGLGEIATPDAISSAAQQLVRRDAVRIEELEPGVWWGSAKSPTFNNTVGRPFHQKRKPSRRHVAELVIRNSLAAMIIDAGAAKALDLPLSSVAHPALFEQKVADEVTVDDVALRMKIPVLSGLSTAQLIKLRLNAPDDFIVFQQALTMAISATLANDQTSNPAAVGEKAWQEILKPALADLERKLTADRWALGVGGFATVSVGFAAAAISLIANLPLAAALLGSAVSATIPLNQFSEYIKDRKQARSSPYYFLWRARKVQTHA